MSDLNINKIKINPEKMNSETQATKKDNELNSVFNKGIKQEEVTPDEDFSKGSNVASDGKFKVTVGGERSGQINNENFKLEKTYEFLTTAIVGEYDNQPVNVKSKNKFFSDGRIYEGSIGENKIELTRKNKGLFNKTVLYNGTYNGKKFNVEFKPNDNGFLDLDEKIKGEYDSQDVDVLYDFKALNTNELKTKSMPKDFGAVLALILTIKH